MMRASTKAIDRVSGPSPAIAQSASNSNESLLWSFPTPPDDVPSWFPDFVKAVACQRFEAGTDIPAAVSPKSFIAVRQRLLESAETDFYTLWAKQWIGNAEHVSQSAGELE